MSAATLSRYPYCCTECGRVGTRDDGIQRIGDDCPDEECTGTIVSNRPSSSFRLWSDRIDGGTITRYQCIQWAHAVQGLIQGWAGGKRTNLTTEEAERLWDKLHDLPNGLALTPDHQEAGRVWMRKYGARVGLPVTDENGHPIDVHAFSFVGAHAYDTGAWRPTMAPIYRTWLADGRVFDYAPTPWQASAYGQGKLPLWWEARP